MVELIKAGGFFPSELMAFPRPCITGQLLDVSGIFLGIPGFQTPPCRRLGK